MFGDPYMHPSGLIIFDASYYPNLAQLICMSIDQPPNIQTATRKYSQDKPTIRVLWVLVSDCDNLSNQIIKSKQGDGDTV